MQASPSAATRGRTGLHAGRQLVAGPGRRRLRAVAAAPTAAATAAPTAAATAAPQVLDRAALEQPGLPLQERVRLAREQLGALGSERERVQRLAQLAADAPQLGPHERTWATRAQGCTAQVWVAAEVDAGGRLHFRTASDSRLSAGLAALLAGLLGGLTPQEVLEVTPADLEALPLGALALTPSRANSVWNLLETLRKRARAAAGDPRAAQAFPSLLITAEGAQPRGAFAAAQAAYLRPDSGRVQGLAQALREKRMGVVAHFYMDPEVQGVLSAARGAWPHIHISDSLVMADAAVRMAEAGCEAVAVLGVDFMAENVRAILDEAGHHSVKVYRMAAETIACSLADAAEAPAYAAFLGAAAARGGPALHVVYINTSLRTKAHAHAAVPTITCTSSNVVQTVLTAFAQVPGCHVYYGPDTYMGANLATLLRELASGPSDAAVAAVHPGHTRASLRAALPRLHCFEEGTCIVHHLFGADVTAAVRAGYGDALLTAHFEVPGEMFALALEAQRRGTGVVGSTSNILDFISAKLAEALERPFPERLQVVLGTESGMVTAIVRRVQEQLRASGRQDVALELVFPVSAEAITVPQEGSLGDLRLVPGPAGGEGCSAEGGCASCPYMKMNTLAALQRVVSLHATPGEALLDAQQPRTHAEQVGGRSLAAAGCEPILHMRAFQQQGRLPDGLVADVASRAGAGGAGGGGGQGGRPPRE